MKLPAELKAHVLAAAARESSPDRRRVSRQLGTAWLVAATTTVAIFLLVGGMRAAERPLTFVLGTAGGWVGISLLATTTSARRGSMIGRPRIFLLLTAVATPVALCVWYIAFAEVSGHRLGPAVPTSAALRCAIVSSALAAGPFAVMMRSRLATDPAHPRATGASLGAVAGAWSGVMMDLHCEQTDVLHVALGHVGPALLLALVGALLGERLLGMHAEA
jgi:hypothetical protein